MKNSILVWHKYVSLIFIVPVLVVALSGALLVYKYEIEQILMPDVVKVNVEENRLDFDALHQQVITSYPKYEIAGWLVSLYQDSADRIYMIKHGSEEWESIYINQYTAKILDKPLPHDTYLMDWMVELHANFLLEDLGVWLVTFVGLVSLFIGVTGILLYKSFYKSLFLLRFDKKFLVFVRDFHKMVGAYMSPLFLVIGIVGVYWGIVHIYLEFSEHEHHPMKVNLYNKDLNIDTFVSKSRDIYKDYRVHYIGFPLDKNESIILYGQEEDNTIYSQYGTMITFDAEDGKFIGESTIENRSLLEKFDNVGRKAHMGYYNMATKIIWFLVGLATLFLAITGTTMWLKMRRRKKDRQIDTML